MLASPGTGDSLRGSSAPTRVSHGRIAVPVPASEPFRAALAQARAGLTRHFGSITACTNIRSPSRKKSMSVSWPPCAAAPARPSCPWPPRSPPSSLSLMRVMRRPLSCQARLFSHTTSWDTTQPRAQGLIGQASMCGAGDRLARVPPGPRSHRVGGRAKGEARGRGRSPGARRLRRERPRDGAASYRCHPSQLRGLVRTAGEGLLDEQRRQRRGRYGGLGEDGGH